MVSYLDNDYKLSDIFDFASQNLKQIKYEAGNAMKHEACAVGAIRYFLTNGKACSRTELKTLDPILQNKVEEFKKKLGIKWPLLILANDFLGIKFQTFSKLCRKYKV